MQGGRGLKVIAEARLIWQQPQQAITVGEATESLCTAIETH
jgi:hypothetical protein